MNIFCKEKYYTLDKIPEYWLQFIGSKVEWLIKELDLKASDWPLDTIKLLERIVNNKILPIKYDFVDDLPGIVDARTEYDEEDKTYIIHINKKKMKKDMKSFIEGRPNFTIWHEIAHVVLEHLLIPLCLKTEEDEEVEELQADEFSGRFLMPKWLVYSCNYYRLSKVAEYLLVSGKALFIRLNNLKSLHTIKSKVVPTCPVCGNTLFSSSAKLCGICGYSVSRGLKGIRRVSYHDESIMGRARREIVCSKCFYYSEEKVNYMCTICNNYVTNYCISHFGQDSNKCSNACRPTQRFCEICGKPTYFYKMKLIKPWQEIYDIPKLGGYPRY